MDIIIFCEDILDDYKSVLDIFFDSEVTGFAIIDLIHLFSITKNYKYLVRAKKWLIG